MSCQDFCFSSNAYLYSWQNLSLKSLIKSLCNFYGQARFPELIEMLCKQQDKKANWAYPIFGCMWVNYWNGVPFLPLHLTMAVDMLPCTNLSRKIHLKLCGPVHLENMDTVLQTLQTKESQYVITSVCNNHNFLPSKLDSVFTLWKEKGILSFKDLFSDGTFTDF